jgi:23S rRNA (cytosine1962-C5)-methyltransferase
VAEIVLKRGGDARIRAGHPWVYRGEIGDLRGTWRPDEPVVVLDAAGRHLGRGHYNPRTSLAVRLLTRERESVDADWFAARLERALAYRRGRALAADAYRLCWSEADGLPGLVVDRYGDLSIVQCLTLGMDRAIGAVAAGLQALFPEDGIFRADDPAAARLEGFAPRREWLRAPAAGRAGASGAPADGPGRAPADVEADAPPADAPAERVVRESACRLAVVPGAGHKTGLYLDQRENRPAVAAHAAGRRVLDAFCYGAAFACHALAAGARAARCVDSSPEALALAARNLALNGVAARAELVEANAFDELRRLERAGERFGLVVLDPPPFTRRKDALEAAARGYKEINIRGLRLLEPGGVLATFSCSHHVTPAAFEAICREAAADAGVPARVLAVLGQSRDHPVLLTIPESRYLTGLLLEAP